MAKKGVVRGIFISEAHFAAYLLSTVGGTVRRRKPGDPRAVAEAILKAYEWDFEPGLRERIAVALVELLNERRS